MEKGLTDICMIIQVRDKYREIKYKTDIKLESRLMVIYLQLLKFEYEQRVRLAFEEEENLKPGIDYMVLSALNIEIEDLQTRLRNCGKLNDGEDSNKFTDCYKFVRTLWEEVQKHLEMWIYTLNLEHMNKSPPKKLFRKFVDLTGPIIDYKINLEIKQRERPKIKEVVKDDKHKNQFILESVVPQKEIKVNDGSKKYDPFKKDLINPDKTQFVTVQPPANNNTKGNKQQRANTANLQQDSVDVKPKVDKNTITEELRNYYRKNWKSLMEDNQYFDISGLDALMATKTLEKGLYDRLKAKPLEYDACCTSVSNTLRHVTHLKTISQNIRNENFQVDHLLQYCDKPLWTLRGIEKNLNGEGRNNASYELKNNNILGIDKQMVTNSNENPQQQRQQNGRSGFNILNNKTRTNSNSQLNNNQLNGYGGQVFGGNNNKQIGLLDRLSGTYDANAFVGNNSIEHLQSQLDYLQNPNDSIDEELPEEVEEICHYRIFNGSFNIELKDANKPKKRMQNVIFFI